MKFVNSNVNLAYSSFVAIDWLRTIHELRFNALHIFSDLVKLNIKKKHEP